MEEREPLAAEAAASTEKSKASIAFLGNSIIYYNDTPRLLEALGGGAIVQDSCLRGGVTLGQLLDRGNGMQAKFVSDDKGSPDVASLLSRAWDFVVMNDYTQAPAREVSRNATVEVLTTRLAPLIAQSGATPILLETWAYRAHTKGSDDLGDTAAFTEALRAGYRVYADALAAVLPPQQQPRVAPVGAAFKAVHAARPELWHALFHTDGFHPSPLGSYLEGLVLHATIFGALPPAAVSLPPEPPALWARARVMQPADAPPNRFPTRDEMVYLRAVAASVCGVTAE